jgi:hypothetical protein
MALPRRHNINPLCDGVVIKNDTDVSPGHSVSLKRRDPDKLGTKRYLSVINTSGDGTKLYCQADVPDTWTDEQALAATGLYALVGKPLLDGIFAE